MTENLTQEIDIIRLREKKTVFYVAAGGSAEGVTIGPGKLNLKIKVQKMASVKGICKFKAIPSSPSPIKDILSRLPDRKNDGDFDFDVLGFNVNMSPGDFLLLGSRQKNNDPLSLANLFFNRKRLGPKLRIYMISCTRVN